MKNKNFKRLRQGVTVWTVHAFEDGTGFIRQHLVAGFPTHEMWGEKRKSSSLFVPYAKEMIPCRWSTSIAKALRSSQQLIQDAGKHPIMHKFSMLDMHACGLQQRYNRHRMFFSRKKAESYLKLVQSGCDVSQLFSIMKREEDE